MAGAVEVWSPARMSLEQKTALADGLVLSVGNERGYISAMRNETVPVVDATKPSVKDLIPFPQSG